MEDLSQKVQKAIENISKSSPELELPKHRYEPFFLKIMSDFCQFHNLPKIKAPQGSVLPHKLFSYILDLMVSSMGEEKREEVMKELKEYKMGLPFDLR